MRKSTAHSMRARIRKMMRKRSTMAARVAAAQVHPATVKVRLDVKTPRDAREVVPEFAGAQGIAVPEADAMPV